MAKVVVTQEKARESKRLIEKAKALEKEGVIVEVPQEMEQDASAVKDEEPGSSSGLQLRGPPP
eukprot:11275201-Karenia_brevis.AAC.1